MSGHYVGLISGTSMDGIDAVVTDFDDAGVTVHATHTEYYPADLKEALLIAIREPLEVPLDESGELKLGYQPAPMIASFMRDEGPAHVRKGEIPVPKGPIEVW